MPSSKCNKKQTRSKGHSKTKKNHKSKIMVTTTIAGVAGTIVLFISGYLISHGVHRIPSIWIGFSGVVLWALSGALYLHSEETSKLAAESPPIPKSPTPSPPKSDMSSQPINISSVNQSGGITAHTVNVGAKERHVSPEQHRSIVAALTAAPRGKVKMMPTQGDSESAAFSRDIGKVLTDAGYTVDSEGWQSFNVFGIQIGVQDAKSMPAHTDPIFKALYAAGIPSTGSKSPAEKDEVWIIVGSKPLRE